ncbi:MAG: acyl-CoA dehydrogenase family protein [Alphaproteobacteria bacterium]|nr:acyl-CoA dehydrogenase family protein [Alphaproteobacteria bacterium]
MPDLIAEAGGLKAALAERAEETERLRRLPESSVRELAEAGFFRALLPAGLGGLEAEPLHFLKAIARLAEADASPAWCAMIGATTALAACFLPDAAAREIFGARDVVTGGVFAPQGEARPVEGGYRLSGRWSWASGSAHCRWLMGGANLAGSGEARQFFFPATEARLYDTWHSFGLCGTGSGDMEVRDIFVPAERSLSLVTGSPERLPGSLPVFGLLALGVAAVCLGIARGAIDDLTLQARTRRPQGSRRLLAERTRLQADLAGAEADWRAADAYLARAVVEPATDGRIIEQRLELRLAASHATRVAQRIVSTMHEAAGGAAIFLGNPLQRRFRDVHVASRHMMVAPASFELAGRLLFGLETDTAML